MNIALESVSIELILSIAWLIYILELLNFIETKIKGFAQTTQSRTLKVPSATVLLSVNHTILNTCIRNVSK